MTADLKHMLESRAPDMIVIPFYRQVILRHFVPICNDRGLCGMTAADYFEPDPNNPGICVN